MVPESWNIVGGVWPRTHDGPDVCSRTRFQSDPEDEAGPSKRPCRLEMQNFQNLRPHSREASTTEHLRMNQANEIKVSDLTGAKALLASLATMVPGCFGRGSRHAGFVVR